MAQSRRNNAAGSTSWTGGSRTGPREHYAGLDVSLDITSVPVRVITDKGTVLRHGK